MTVTAETSVAVSLTVGQTWHMSAFVVDDDGIASSTAPVVTVTLPNGTTTTPDVSAAETGRYSTTVVTAVAGRHTAVWATAFGAAHFSAWADPVVTAAGMPDRAEFKEYAGLTDTSRDDEIDVALVSEAAAQRAVCRVPAAYPPDLREALMRRVARNLALRLLPLAVLRGDGETGSDTILPGRDPEIRRLEAPHRKMRMG